ncbi:hypothetical protein [Streptomyces clavuligerus]|uniref:Putative acetyltranferase n=1 Tax=Streptomyces clavuligerus TaxID=1901 RepID=Q6TMU4_STRCL|nr:hypothetical protein [Streptomyces clavuligerus]AAQ93529.1 putative acetyltranferase [Streptomyces clavuligerus]AXU16826.1 hypothetical protein D1794_29100 [Streptomyces clavuligerus]EDY48762.1 conserved hypothetical protein [Streptomyces clavuligerus]MBY6300961.1 hypothetical protein [Streptomyces clavuligerus]QPJ97028.1 hypothetical protein GE265_28355 [Streptomyces clavuligerus]
MTHTTSRLPARLTAEDLTLADVDALVAFLDTRIRAAMAGHHSESDTWKAVLATQLVLKRFAKETREAYGRTDRSPQTEQDRFRRWNLLATLALGWKDDVGFDLRWRIVAHPSADGAAAYAILCGRPPVTTTR